MEAEHFTLYLDDSGAVVNTTVRVGALRVVGGLIVTGVEADHAALRSAVAEAFEGIACDWHATELSRARLARGTLPSWVLRELEDHGTTEAQFRRGLGDAHDALRLRLRAAVQRRVGATVARLAREQGAVLVCFEHDTVGATGRRDAMLDAIVEHAAWFVGGRPGAAPATLHVLVEANGAETHLGRSPYATAAAVITSADAPLRSRGGRGVVAGDCAFAPAREASGRKQDGPSGLVLADFIANAFGPGSRGAQPFAPTEAAALTVARFRQRAKSRLTLGADTPLLACGAGPTSFALHAKLLGLAAPPLDPTHQLQSDVQASWDCARSLRPWCGS
jgi:hypothetical protein